MRNFIPLKLSGGTKAVKYIVTMQFNRWSLLLLLLLLLLFYFPLHHIEHLVYLLKRSIIIGEIHSQNLW